MFYIKSRSDIILCTFIEKTWIRCIQFILIQLNRLINTQRIYKTKDKFMRVWYIKLITNTGQLILI